MANKYALNAKAILLNNGTEQLLPVSKAKLIELAKSQQGQFGEGVVDVEGALSYLLGQDATNLGLAKTYTVEQIAALDSSVAARTGYVLTSVTEADGKLTGYTEKWLDASIVSYNGDGKVADALTDIYGQLAAISGTGSGSIKDQIDAAINGLNVEKIGEAGKAIVSVSQENGKVFAELGNIKAQYVDVDNADDKFNYGKDKPTTLTAQATLEHLQGEIKAVEAAAAKYTIDEVTNGLDANVAKRYKLTQSINGVSSQAGTVIDIPKDRSLKEVYLGSSEDTVDAASGDVIKKQATDPQSMNFVYHLADGTYSLTKIDVSKFLSESEFKDGLNVNGGKVSVKIAEGSESFLTVGPEGVKLSGVQTAIDTAANGAKTYADGLIANLDSSLGQEYEDSATAQVITGVTQTDGKLSEIKSVALNDAHVKTTPFTGQDLASLLGNENLPSNLHEALNKIAGKVSAGAANAVTDVKGSKGTYVEVKASKSGNDVTLTVDDTALGNVAALKYDVLASDVESVTILG